MTHFWEILWQPLAYIATFLGSNCELFATFSVFVSKNRTLPSERLRGKCNLLSQHLAGPAHP